jgi:hypothetical protein
MKTSLKGVMRMAELLNFREFYQKSTILISENDRLAIQNEAGFTKMIDSFTHWLIALEGIEISQKSTEWRVVIFPTSIDGQFDYKLPFFKSPCLQTFNEAFELARKIENLAKQDQLNSIKI